MNHGILCRKYYKKQEWDKSVHTSDKQFIEKLTDYFSHYNSRNLYYTAMKHKTVITLYNLKHTMYEIRDVLNLKNHATVNHYIHHYKKFIGYNEFVNEYYMDCILNDLYPKTVLLNTGETTFKLIKKEDL